MSGPVRLYSRRLFSDQLTPVVAYRRLVAPDERSAVSFLFESVEQGGAVGRYSMLGAQPMLEVVARGNEVTLIERPEHSAPRERTMSAADPLAFVRDLRPWTSVEATGPLPACFHGGWVGYVGFDAVRWMEWEKLPLSEAPHDDRRLDDMHLALYRDVVVFDHASKSLYLVCAVLHDEESGRSVDAIGSRALNSLESRLLAPSPPLAQGRIDLDIAAVPSLPGRSATGEARFCESVDRAKEYIAAGDAFQVVLSQRFERESQADPFDVYRALRIVNPSPYQAYLQTRSCILVSASPEILCRTRGDVVVNRPLAGTRRRGRTQHEDEVLAQELLADRKERAEHAMLVDLGRNDLGRVCERGSVRVKRCMEIERFSHVMHISSTIDGKLAAGMDSWDVLRATLPVGTVSGAPKVRAIQIIDELEPVRRGPYAGAFGAVGWDGDLDMAIAIRTMVVPFEPVAHDPDGARRWIYHLQAGAGIVMDSDPASEHAETVNKSAALARAIDLAERIRKSRPGEESRPGCSLPTFGESLPESR